MVTTPDQAARQKTDRLLALTGWSVQDVASANLQAALGVAIRELAQPWPWLCELPALYRRQGLRCHRSREARRHAHRRGGAEHPLRPGPAGGAAGVAPSAALRLRGYGRRDPLHQRPGPRAARAHRLRIPPAGVAGVVAEAPARTHRAPHRRLGAPVRTGPTARFWPTSSKCPNSSPNEATSGSGLRKSRPCATWKLAWPRTSHAR